MTDTYSSKDYAQRLLSNVQKINREKEAQKNKIEKILNIFSTLNTIITNAVLENGLTEFITLTSKKGELELSNSPYQSNQKSIVNIDYLEASCAGIELTFFKKNMIRDNQRNLELNLTVSPEESGMSSSLINEYKNGAANYAQKLNEQYTLQYGKQTEEWTLNIYDRNSKKFITPDETLTTDSIMRIFYSAFDSVIK